MHSTFKQVKFSKLKKDKELAIYTVQNLNEKVVEFYSLGNTLCHKKFIISLFTFL